MAIQAETIKYGPWPQGVRYDLPPEDIAPNGLRQMENARLTAAAAIEKALGTASYQSLAAIAGTPTFTAAGEFQIPGGSKKVFAVAGAKFYEYSSGWVDRTGAVTITAGDDNTFEWVVAYDHVVLTNGVDAPFKWTGSGNATVLDVDSRFTTAEHVAFFDNRLWMGNVDTNYDRYWYSNIGDIETWDVLNFNNLGSPIGALQANQNVLAFHTDDFISIAIATGNAVRPYQVQQRTSSDPRNPQTGGSISGRAVVTIPGNAQLFPQDDGIYMWAGGDRIEKVSHALDLGYWDTINMSRLGQSFAVFYAQESEVWFWLPYGVGQQNMNHIMVMSTKFRYQDPATGEPRFAWYGPLTGNTSAFERNCGAIIDNKPHAGGFAGKLLNHAPANTFNQEGAAYTSYFETAAPAPLGSDVDLRWLYAKTYYDALGDYTVTINQESQGVGVNSGTLATTGGGGQLDTFELDVDTLGTVRMVSKDNDLRGYDPHSSLKFTNNSADETYRIRRTHLQFKIIGRGRKPPAGGT